MGVSIPHVRTGWISSQCHTVPVTTLTIRWSDNWSYIPVAGDLIVIWFDEPSYDLVGPAGWVQPTQNVFYKIVDKFENSPTFTSLRAVQDWQWRIFVAQPGEYELTMTSEEMEAANTPPHIEDHEGKLSG